MFAKEATGHHGSPRFGYKWLVAYVQTVKLLKWLNSTAWLYIEILYYIYIYTYVIHMCIYIYIYYIYMCVCVQCVFVGHEMSSLFDSNCLIIEYQDLRTCDVGIPRLLWQRSSGVTFFPITHWVVMFRCFTPRILDTGFACSRFSYKTGLISLTYLTFFDVFRWLETMDSMFLFSASGGSFVSFRECGRDAWRFTHVGYSKVCVFSPDLFKHVYKYTVFNTFIHYMLNEDLCCPMRLATSSNCSLFAAQVLERRRAREAKAAVAAELAKAGWIYTYIYTYNSNKQQQQQQEEEQQKQEQ